MAGSFLRTADDRREPGVQLATPSRRDLLIDGGSKEGGGEPKTVADDLDDVVLDRGIKRASIGDGAIVAATVSRLGNDKAETISSTSTVSFGSPPRRWAMSSWRRVGDREPLADPTSSPRRRTRVRSPGRRRLAPDISWMRESTVRGNRSPTVSRMTRSTSSEDSGPTWTTSTRRSANAGTTPRGSTSASDPRTALSTPIGSSLRRRRTNCTASRGPVHPLRVVDRQGDRRGGRHRTEAPQDRQRDGPAGRPARRYGASRAPPRAPRVAARAASAGPRPGPARRGRPRRRTTTRLGLDGAARERPVLALEGSRQPWLPRSVFPMPGSPDRRRALGPVGIRIQESVEDRELGLAPDDVTGQTRSPA